MTSVRPEETRERQRGRIGSKDVDPSKIDPIEISSDAVRQQFVEHCADWAQRPPFYNFSGELPRLVCGRYSDVAEVYRDQSRFSNAVPTGPGMERFHRFMGMNIVAHMDGREHNRIRRLLNPAFNATSLNAISADIEAVVDNLLDNIEQNGPAFDGMKDFADDMMARVLMDRMFMLATDHKEAFYRASKAMEVATSVPPDQPLPDEYTLAGDHVRSTIIDLVQQRRKNPGPDFISRLISIRDEGNSLNDEELFTQIFTLCGGALNSTAGAMGGIFLTLFRDPKQLALVRDDPELIPGAVEESLRRHGPAFLSFPRWVVADTEIAGVPALQGMAVFASQQAACLDPEEFQDPLRYDIFRRPKDILAFGSGIHHCLGQRLARMVLQTGLRRMLHRFPKVVLTDLDYIPHYYGMGSETRPHNVPMNTG